MCVPQVGFFGKVKDFILCVLESILKSITFSRLPTSQDNQPAQGESPLWV